MIIELRSFVLSSLGFLLLAFFGQPIWTAFHGALAKLPSPTRSLTTASTPVGDVASKNNLPSNQSYGTLPIYFEPNLGQTDSRVKFIARVSGATTFLTATEAVFSLPVTRHSRDNGNPVLPVIPTEEVIGMPVVGFGGVTRGLGPGVRNFSPLSPEIHSPQSAIANRRSAITMRLVGANPNAPVEGIDRLPGISNYFIGNDPNKWCTSIPHYAKVRYRDVYPGIDLVYYGNQQDLEYDLVVQPGANPTTARVLFEGATGVRLDASGNVVVTVANGELSLHHPHIYQEHDGIQTEVSGRYVLQGDNGVGFALGTYNTARALTIDPVLSYSTYLGGGLTDVPSAIAVDPTGAAYVTGYTKSVNFPVTPGVFQPTHPGTVCGNDVLAAPCDQVFIAKINPAGTALLYCTYLGGRIASAQNQGGERATAITVDSQGNALLTGWTHSTDFPTSAALQPNNKGLGDGFLTKLNSAGSGLVFSTYLGGSGSEAASALAVDLLGNSYVALLNDGGPDLPTSSTSHRVFGNNKGTLVLKVTPAGSALLYSAVIGATTANAIAVDSVGAAYLAGQADETGFPTVNAIQPTFHGVFVDAFVTKIDPAGTSLVYSTYLGGSGSDTVFGIAVDQGGSAYLAGATTSSDFPTTSGAFQLYRQAVEEARANNFVAKLSSSGTTLAYSTYLLSSPPAGDALCGIAVDGIGEATVVGSTSNPDFPVSEAIQPYYAGRTVAFGEQEDSDAYVIKLNSVGTAALYSTFLGGNRRDLGNSVALDSAGNAYVIGVTRSTDFPVYRALHPTLSGDLDPQSFNNRGDIFIAKIAVSPVAAIETVTSPSFNTEGGNGRIAVTGPAGFSWAVASQADWIRIPSGSTGTGSGVVTYTIAPLPLNSSPRTGTLVVAGKVFRVTQEADDIFVPAVLSVAGLSNSFFTSELTLANRADRSATLQFSYTATPDLGGGSGVATDSLPAGHQRIIPDALAYLRMLGLSIPDSGSRLGTLRIRVSGVLTSEVTALVRVTTAVAANRVNAVGRVGLSYPAIRTSQALTGTSFICGLQQTLADRSNVAVQNAGVPTDGDITLRLTVFSGNPGAPLQRTLSDVRLAPGEFRQISGILQAEGLSLTSGYVKVERISGVAPYYAYGIVNDQANSDGSFVAAQRSEDRNLVLPAVVETGSYSSEVVVTNTSNATKTLVFRYYAPGVQGEHHEATHRRPIQAGEQIIIPDFVAYLRQSGVEVVKAQGIVYAGYLWVDPVVMSGNFEVLFADGVFTQARVSTPGAGGRIGLSISGGSRSNSQEITSRWVFGLQQNGESRSNLALVNPFGYLTIFRIELFDGNTGTMARTIENVSLPAGGWTQLNGILRDYAPGVQQGYARVIPVADGNGFVTYGVLNDGAAPGERTGDGAFITSAP